MTIPRFIYFTGVDGSGKSTIIEEIISDCSQKGIRAQSVWLRFNYFFTKPVLLFCRISGMTRREQRGNRVISVHDFHRSKIVASLVQYLHYIDTLCAFIIKVWLPLRLSDRVIFCDKFVYDILADFMVETKDFDLLNRRITRLFLKLIPGGMPVFFIYADRNDIVKRKPEVLLDDEDYDLKYRAYQAIMNHFHFTIIENVSLQDSIRSIKSKIGL